MHFSAQFSMILQQETEVTKRSNLSIPRFTKTKLQSFFIHQTSTECKCITRDIKDNSFFTIFQTSSKPNISHVIKIIIKLN